MNTEPTWTKDWLLFTEELERALQEGASNDYLATLFGNHQIQWLGTIEKIDIDELSATVNVALPRRTVALANGETIMLDGLTLAIAENSESVWQGFEPGDEVMFDGKFGEPKSPFTCVEVRALRGGGNIIMIRIGNAVPHLNSRE